MCLLLSFLLRERLANGLQCGRQVRDGLASDAVHVLLVLSGRDLTLNIHTYTRIYTRTHASSARTCNAEKAKVRVLSFQRGTWVRSNPLYRRYQSIYHIVSLQFSCCDLSVREKDWRGKPGL